MLGPSVSDTGFGEKRGCVSRKVLKSDITDSRRLVKSNEGLDRS